MKLINGLAKPNHFGCMCCAIDLGSDIPVMRPHSLKQSKISVSYKGMMIHYPEFSYECDECGYPIRTPEQCEDLAMERELAELEADLFIALREEQPFLEVVK